MQISKYIAHSGICSRRKADSLVVQGFIMVNGTVMMNPAYRLKEGDVVTHKDDILTLEKHVYVLLNKPKGYITTVADERERKTVLNLVALGDKVRLYPVGRLDRATTGLVILTNDGTFAQKMAHPRNKIVKRYHITLDRPLSVHEFQHLKKGVVLPDGFVKPDTLVFVEGSKRTELFIELHSGKNQIIRRMFQHFGAYVTKLDRFYYAGLTKRGLVRGAWRYLSSDEVAQLLKN